MIHSLIELELTAVLAFPARAREMSAAKSPTEFAHARNVNPIIAVGIFHITPSAVNKPTTSFASVNIFTMLTYTCMLTC